MVELDFQVTTRVMMMRKSLNTNHIRLMIIKVRRISLNRFIDKRIQIYLTLKCKIWSFKLPYMKIKVSHLIFLIKNPLLRTEKRNERHFQMILHQIVTSKARIFLSFDYQNQGL